MKRIGVFVTVLVLLCGIMTGCNPSASSGVTAAVYAPDGAPTIGFAKMIHDEYKGAAFHVVPPTDIGSAVLGGKADIAIMPTNAAASLYTRGADIAMLGVTNFGSLYLVGKGDTVTALADLKGKVVYSIGQGNVPDLVFRYLLRQAGITYRFGNTAQADVVTLDYVKEGTEIIGGLTAGKMQYGVISEPAATVALNKVPDAECMLDIQALYSRAAGTDEGFPQAALVVKKSFLDKNYAYVQSFVDAFRSGVKWSETAPAEALAAIKTAGSTTVPMLNAAIAKGCHLGFEAAMDYKQQLLDFYAALDAVKEEGETPIGSRMPDDAFFLPNLATAHGA